MRAWVGMQHAGGYDILTALALAFVTVAGILTWFLILHLTWMISITDGVVAVSSRFLLGASAGRFLLAFGISGFTGFTSITSFTSFGLAWRGWLARLRSRALGWRERERGSRDGRLVRFGRGLVRLIGPSRVGTTQGTRFACFAGRGRGRACLRCFRRSCRRGRRGSSGSGHRTRFAGRRRRARSRRVCPSSSGRRELALRRSLLALA